MPLSQRNKELCRRLEYTLSFIVSPEDEWFRVSYVDTNPDVDEVEITVYDDEEWEQSRYAREDRRTWFYSALKAGGWRFLRTLDYDPEQDSLRRIDGQKIPVEYGSADTIPEKLSP